VAAANAAKQGVCLLQSPVFLPRGASHEAALIHEDEATITEWVTIHEMSNSTHGEVDTLGLPMEMPFDSSKSGISTETVICGVTAIFGVALATMLWHEWGKLPKHQTALSRDSGRLFLLDNVKWFAQLLVIYGHLLGMLNIWDTSTWLYQEEDFIRMVKDALEVVLNPLFCVISGVLSQGAPTEGRLRRYVQFLVIPTIMVVYVVRPLCSGIFRDRPMDKAIQKILSPDITPTYFSTDCPWYLFALVLWRASVYLFWSQMKTEVAFVTMVGASCAAGYLGGINADQWGGGWGATLGYLPYFAAGYVMPFGALAERIQKPGLLGSVGVAAGVWIYAFFIVPAVFGFSLPDGHGNYVCCDSGREMVLPGKLTPLDVTFYWLRRLAQFAVDMPAVLAVIFMVLPRDETPITYMGAHTLYSYIFHMLVGFHSQRALLLQWFGMPVIQGRIWHILILLLHIPYCLAILCFLTSSYWRAIWSWAISPQWPAVLFPQKPETKAASQGEKIVDTLAAEPRQP